MRRNLAICLAWISVLAACQPAEYAILIEGRSEGDIDTLEVIVQSLEDGLVLQRSMSPIRRSRAEIASGDPIRVTVELDSAHNVLVHLGGLSRNQSKFIATRCYAVTGVLRDDVMLVSVAADQDLDGDGFPADPAAACFDSEGGACTQYLCDAAVAGDCDDRMPCAPTDTDCVDPATIFPGAPIICEDGIDQDCDGADEACEDADGDGSVTCKADDLPGTCDCDDNNPDIHPGAEEIDICQDGIDQDCKDGDAGCDLDGDGYMADREIGGFPDCDDTNPAINPGADEVCTPEGGDRLDENCNGHIDELPGCLADDLDADGFEACMPGGPANCDCNDCDAGVNPGAADACGDNVDQDCSNGGDPADGGDPACHASDTDHDGSVDSAAGGTDCDDDVAQTFPGAPEKCGDGTSQSCSSDQSCDGDTDGDGYVEPQQCEDDDTITPWLPELCNGRDDDCDGIVDEVLAPPEGDLPQGQSGCIRDAAEAPAELNFLDDFVHCGGCRITCDARTTDDCVGGVCDCTDETGSVGACTGGDACCGGGRRGGCKDLATDIDNCGSCGRQCDEKSDRCVGGACGCGGGAACTGASICCGGSCLNPTADLNNCGGCNVMCDAGGNRAYFECSDSTCSRQTCADDKANCDRSNANGCETDLGTLTNCGSCNDLCAAPAHATPKCEAFNCAIDTCVGAWDDCNNMYSDGCERQLETLTNCSGCGDICSAPGNATPRCNGSGASASCMWSCDAGTHNCSGTCATNTDTATCGTLCSPCPSRSNATTTCDGTNCGFTCTGAFRDCDGMPATGCEANTGTDPLHCGGCPTACSVPANGSATCVGGTCGISCDPGFHECTGSCVSDTAATSCGGRCAPCPGPGANGSATCVAGACGITCDSGFHECAGACFADSDANNCGASCVTCPATNGTATCDGTSCGISCDPSYHECSGACFADSDVDNCGPVCITCPVAVGATRACSSSMCGFTCTGANEDCDGATTYGCETDTDTDSAHCGGCGMPCGANETCVSGNCECGSTGGLCSGMLGTCCDNAAGDGIDCRQNADCV